MCAFYVGNLSGDISFRRTQFFIAFGLAIFMSWASYTLPVIGALTQPYTDDDWDNGYLVHAYNQILNGLGYAVVIGGICSCFSLYFVELSVAF